MKKSRTFRKSFVAAIAALCLAAPLAMMPMTVSADGSYSITITATDNASTHNYVAYQIFDGDFDGGVLSNIVWGTGVDTTKIDNGVTLINAIQAISVNNTTPFDELDEASEIANKLSEYQSKDNAVVKAFAEVVGDYLGATSGTAGSSGVTNLNDAGYYLVQDSGDVTGEGAKTRYILQVAGADVTVTAKSSYPTIVKKVKENTDVDSDYDINGDKDISTFDTEEYKNYNDVADYNIGDDVPFIDIGTLPGTLDDYDEYYYEIVDTSDKQFEPNVTVDGEGKTTGITVRIDGVVVTDQATITKTIDDYGNTTIKVVFEDIKSIDKGDDGNTTVNVTTASIVTVEYDSELTKNAEIGLNGQESKVELNFSNDPNNPTKDVDGDKRPDSVGTTPEDKVIVFTYELDVKKYLDNVANGNEAGTGDRLAKFKLYRKNPNNSLEEQVAILESNIIKEWVKSENGNGTPIDTSNGGVVKFKGIDEGEYTLRETEAPPKYNTMPDKSIKVDANTLDVDLNLNDNITVDRQKWSGVPGDALTELTISVDGGTEVGGVLDDGIVNMEVVNQKGSSLPSTGGIGTTIFYLGGGTMAAVAGVYLITKKRMKNEEDDEI